MNQEKKRYWIIPYLLLGIYMLFVNISYAQWSTPTAITSDTNTDLNPAMTVAMGGRTYVAFQSNRTPTGTPGDNNIWVTYWDGSAWSADEKVSILNLEDTYPDMTTDAYDQPWVVWYVPGGPYAVYYNGTNWTAPMRVHNGTLGGFYPDITADDNGFVYVTWHYNNGVDFEIYCSQFDPSTSTWTPRQITLSLFTNEERPQIAIDNVTDDIYFFYMSNRDNPTPNTQSIYSRHLISGAGSAANYAIAVLSAEIRADTDDSGFNYFDRPTSLIWHNVANTLYGGWFSNGSDMGGLGMNPVVNDMPGGGTWNTPPTVLSAGAFGVDSGCSLIVENNTNNIWATWTSTRDTNTNIFSNYFDGFGWLFTDIRVCQNTSSDTVDYYTQGSPGICYDTYGGSGRVWTAWVSDRDGDSNIYVANNEAPFDNTPPTYQAANPAPDAQGVPLDRAIYIEVMDDAWGPSDDYSPCGVNIDSLIMIVEGSTVIDMTRTPPDQYDPDHVTIEEVNKFFSYGITYTPPNEFTEGDKVNVYLYACDRGDNDTGNNGDKNCSAYDYSFYASAYAWPQFQHDTQHRGEGYFSAPDLTSIKWYDEPGGYVGSPVVGVGDRVIFGSSDGFLNVLGANGSIIDRFYSGSEEVTGAPALGSNGTIYFGTLGGKIIAIDSNDYSQKWQRQTGGPITAPITITLEGTIIVASEDAKVYAIEPSNNLLWQYQTTDKIKVAPAADMEGNVYVATYDGKLYSLYNGTTNWVYQTPSHYPIESSPTISADGTIIFGSWDGNIYGIYKDTGILRDSFNIGTGIIGSPAVDFAGNIYIGSGFSVYSLEWDIFTNNMALRWFFTPFQPDHMGIFNSSPCISYPGTPFGYDSLFIGNNKGVLFQLDMVTGSYINIWDDFNGGAISTGLAIGRSDVLYVASGGRMYAFGSGTGNNQPRLDNGSVTPDYGNTSTEFTYEVTYYDADQDDPQVARVYIDGNPLDMSFSSGTPNNGKYTYTTTLSASYTHNFYFYFTDGKGGTRTLMDPPSSSTPFDGPDVGNPLLYSGDYFGTCPSLTYSVTYQDQFPADEAKLFVDGASTNMITGSLPPNMNYTGTTPPGVNANDYYCFKFTDQIGNYAYFPQTGGWIEGENCDDATEPTWACFKGNRLRTGISKFEATAGPDILWFYDSENSMFSSPVIDNSDNIYYGDYYGFVYSLDSTGNLIWTFDALSAVKSTPSMDEAGNLYFGTQNGRIYSITNAGAERWSMQTGGSVYSSPAVSSMIDNGMGGLDSRIYVGSSDAKLYSLSSISGQAFWEYLNPSESPISFSSPCIGPTGLIYFGTMDGTMWAVKDNTTAPILQWTYKTNGAIESTPVATSKGDLIFGSADGKIYSLHIFNLEKDPDSELYIPQLNWKYATGNSVPSSPAVTVDGDIAIGSRDNKLYYLYSSGTKKWDYSAIDDIESSPVIDSAGNVIFSSRDGRVYSLTEGGEPNWIFDDSSGDPDADRPPLVHVYTSPALTSEGNVIFGGFNNSIIYCLRTDDGAPYFMNEDPPDGSTDVVITQPTVSVEIFDDQSNINPDSIIMTVQNSTVTPDLTKYQTPPLPYGYLISLNVMDQFQWGERVLVTAYGCDSGSMENCSEIQWNFTMEPDNEPPNFNHLKPGNGDSVPQNFIIRMAIRDFESGIDESTIKLSIIPSTSTVWTSVTPSVYPIQDGYYIEYEYVWGFYPTGNLSIKVEANDKAIPDPNIGIYRYTVNVLLGASPNP